MPETPTTDLCGCQAWKGAEPLCPGCEAVARGDLRDAKPPPVEMGDSWLCCHVGSSMPYFQEGAFPYVQAFVRMAQPAEARHVIARGTTEAQYRETQRNILRFALEYLIR